MSLLAHLFLETLQFSLLGKRRRIIRCHTVAFVLSCILLDFFKTMNHVLQLAHVIFLLLALVADFWQERLVGRLRQILILIRLLQRRL